MRMIYEKKSLLRCILFPDHESTHIFALHCFLGCNTQDDVQAMRQETDNEGGVEQVYIQGQVDTRTGKLSHWLNSKPRHLLGDFKWSSIKCALLSDLHL